MSQSMLIARKDLSILFRSPLAYLIMACYLAISGYIFSNLVNAYQQASFQLMQNPNPGAIFTPTAVIIPQFMQNSAIVLIFLLPLLTMRGFSEEKRMGTFEVLVSYPLTELQIVTGKLTALALFLLVLLAASFINPSLLFIFTEPELLPMLSAYLGLFLMSVSFLAIGLFLSSLTESQILSALFAFAAIMMLYLLSWLGDANATEWAKILSDLSPLRHFQNFTKGVLDFADLAYYLTFTVGFSFLTMLSLENQRWRA